MQLGKKVNRSVKDRCVHDHKKSRALTQFMLCTHSRKENDNPEIYNSARSRGNAGTRWYRPVGFGVVRKEEIYVNIDPRKGDEEKSKAKGGKKRNGIE